MRCKGSYIDAGEKLQDALMVRPSAHSVPHNLLRYTHTHLFVGELVCRSCQQQAAKEELVADMQFKKHALRLSP